MFEERKILLGLVQADEIKMRRFKEDEAGYTGLAAPLSRKSLLAHGSP
jgi:hypothetical protein